MKRKFTFLLTFVAMTPLLRAAETCTTQSAMAPPDRAALADAAREIALSVQSNDAATLRASATPEIQQNFGALQYLVSMTSPKLAGATPQVSQLYLLEASTFKTSDSNSEAQFFCSLNKTTQEVDFTIRGLTAGRYAFVIADVQAHPSPWQLSMLLRQDVRGKWLVAGFYPKALTIAGHDGLWYWTQARAFSQKKQPWNAWLYYQAAQTLLRPADFVLSSHLEKLRTETMSAAPPALSDGLSPQTPLTLKVAVPAAAPNASGTRPGGPTDATETIRFTALAVVDLLNTETVTPMLSARFSADAIADPTAARQRNMGAAKSLLAAYPELRAFETISISADSPGQPTLTTTLATKEVN